MTIIAADTETFPFGLQSDGSMKLHPDIICTTWAFRTPAGISASIVSDGDDGDMKEMWGRWLSCSDTLVFHHAAYDLSVACATWPEFTEKVWAKLERGEITCTIMRQKLLNLSTHGNLESLELPDGSSKRLAYGLADLASDHLGVTVDGKDDPDSPRTQFALWSGLRSRDYPPSARDYAVEDAHLTLSIYEAQQALVQTETAHASLSTEFFQTAASFALAQISQNGMRIDAKKWHELHDEMSRVLNEDNLRPIIKAKILRPTKPGRVHKRQEKRALEVLAAEFPAQEWTTMPDVEQLTEDQLAVLEAEGISFTRAIKASVNRKELCARIAAICADIGKKPTETPSGGIAAGSDIIQSLLAFDSPLDTQPGDEELEEGHPRLMSPLECFQYRQSVQKIVSTELPRMTWGAEDPITGERPVAERVFFNFNPLVSTGRTSSFASNKYPSGNGQNVDPRARPCYLPEEGQLLLSSDYSTLELCSVGQITYDLFGQSKHRDYINEGRDLHGYLGSVLASYLSDWSGDYDGFMSLKSTDPAFFGKWRKFAKPVGLGYPGGQGPVTTIGLAKKSYGVDIVAAAQEVPVEMLPGPDNSTVAWHAKKLGMTEQNWQWTPYIRGIALSMLLKQLWMQAYPEMKPFFEWVKSQKDPHNARWKDGERQSLMCYTSPLGMHRAGAPYTAAANGMAMQTPSGEGAKTATFRLAKECSVGRLRGRAKLLNFIHDEFLLSVPSDPEACNEVVAIVEEVMVESMAGVFPDVRISVESALSRRWLKQAAPVRSRPTNLLLPWEPDVGYERDAEGNLWTA